jgi:hypothetical protein
MSRLTSYPVGTRHPCSRSVTHHADCVLDVAGPITDPPVSVTHDAGPVTDVPVRRRRLPENRRSVLRSVSPMSQHGRFCGLGENAHFNCGRTADVGCV